MNYLLDTNIILHYLKRSPLAIELEEKHLIFTNENTLLVSVVSLGELKSLGIRNKWGEKRFSRLEQLTNRLLMTKISAIPIIEIYGEIDAYSQNKIANKPLGMTARNMGKNDLWIAATAAVLKLTLVTFDKDFDHLNGTYFPVIR